ncbi:MAG: cold shock domain-containing protein [Phascolarctobacterium sp.]|nr:cold shock domain-containing protein [Acidaminococcaceae bacterium]MBQ7883835.1 cold shock domain-containing protein [Phascolarctobacterium sp.]
MTGKVKWFNAEKGYGFIECGDGKDIFVHYTAIKMNGFRTLIEGRSVKFDLINNRLGPKAINVIQLDPLR